MYHSSDISANGTASAKAASDKSEADKIKSKLDEIAKRLENATSDSEKQKIGNHNCDCSKKYG